MTFYAMLDSTLSMAWMTKNNCVDNVQFMDFR